MLIITIFKRTVADAINECKNNRLANELWIYEHENKNINSNDSEYKSWKESLPILLNLLSEAGYSNNTICFEYPSIGTGGRIDAILIGSTKGKKDELIIFELKQWSYIKSENLNSPVEVSVPIGQNKFDSRMHPLRQLQIYLDDLKDNNSAVKNNKNVIIHEVALIHNCNDISPFISGKYHSWNNFQEFSNNIYGKNDLVKLKEKLAEWMSDEPNYEFAKKFTNAEYKLTLSDLGELKSVLSGKKNANMIQDQLEIDTKVQKIMRCIKKGKLTNNYMIIISGQPGTGKTIVGLHFLFDYVKIFKKEIDVDGITNKNESWKASKEIFSKLNALFVLPRSYTVHEVINSKTNISIPYLTDNGIPGNTDVLIIDEAHRIQDISKDLKLAFKKSKLVILLQDDKQTVKPSESGTVSNFIKFANDNNIPYKQLNLTTQKRSGLQSNIMKSIDGMLYRNEGVKLDLTLNVKVCSSPFELEKIIKEDAKNNNEHRNKIIASFDWPWNKTQKDIQIKINNINFEKPWNPQKGSQAKWYWAKGQESIDNKEIDKVGCIYTVQGLEFDTVGFIWGKDFRWDAEQQNWMVYPGNIKDKLLKNEIKNTDKMNSKNIMKNIYRVLMTRATKNMYIYFEDKETEKHVMQSLNLNRI